MLEFIAYHPSCARIGFRLNGHRSWGRHFIIRGILAATETKPRGLSGSRIAAESMWVVIGRIKTRPARWLVRESSANAELFQAGGIKLGAPRSFLYFATQLVVALAAPRYSANSFLSSREEKHYAAEDEISAVRREYVSLAKNAEKGCSRIRTPPVTRPFPRENCITVRLQKETADFKF